MTDLKLSPPWRNAVKELIDAGLTYGSEITTGEITKLCDLTAPTSIDQYETYKLKLLQCITEIKEALLKDHQMLLVTNRDSSYRVIKPNEQTAYAIEHGRKEISRAMQRMSLQTQFVNQSLLTDSQRRQNADAQAKISMLSGMNKLSASELHQIVA